MACAFERRSGALLWQQTLQNVGLPLDQPRHVPLLILNYTRQEADRTSATGLLECYDTRTGELLYRQSDHTHIYYSLEVSRREEWVELRLRQRSAFLDYGAGD